MKRLFTFTLLMTIFQICSFAQKGSILLYGNIDILSTKYSEDDKESHFSINPGIGYQFSDHMTAGVDLAFTQWKVNDDKITQLNAGPFFRYSMPIAGIFSAYTQVGVGYASLKTEDTQSGFYAYVFPAIFMQVHNGFGLNFSTGRLSYDKIGDISSFGFNYGIVPTIGVSVNFGGNKSAE